MLRVILNTCCKGSTLNSTTLDAIGVIDDRVTGRNTGNITTVKNKYINRYERKYSNSRRSNVLHIYDL